MKTPTPNPKTHKKAQAGFTTSCEAYNRLQSAAVAFGEKLPIPEIVAVGGQSDGKSSLLEVLLGFRFNVCEVEMGTWRPSPFRWSTIPPPLNPDANFSSTLRYRPSLISMRGYSVIRGHWSGSTQSEESVLDMERNISNCPHLPLSPFLQPYASAGQHPESNAAYFSWPTSTLLHGAAEGRANYFMNLQKGVLPGNIGRLPNGQQATTLLDLMTIRAFHSKILCRFSPGTAIGFQIRKGTLTDIPAILVFVAR